MEEKRERWMEWRREWREEADAVNWTLEENRDKNL